jgi:autophagy-related protein 16-1
VCQVLLDEINTLQLELGQIEERNQILMRDNAKLLQRWLDTKQHEANRMNEANEFYEDMRSQRDAILTWREGSGQPNGGVNDDQVSVSASAPGSGNGEAKGDEVEISTKDGTPSPPKKDVDLTPNG